MEQPALAEAWGDFLERREQATCCCSYPETPEFLALLMTMMGFDAIAKNTWSVEDEWKERQDILQHYEKAMPQDFWFLGMEYHGDMTRLVWQDGKWKLHYHAGKTVRKGRTDKEYRVDKTTKANQSATLAYPLPNTPMFHRLLGEDHCIGDRKQEWPVQSPRRKMFFARLLGMEAHEIPWETNTACLLVAPPAVAASVFSQTEVAFGKEERIPLGELLTVEFRHRTGAVDVFWQQVRQYPDKTSHKIATKPQLVDRMKFRVSAQPILQVVEDLETMQSAWQEDRACVDVTRMAVWTVRKAQQQAVQLEVLIKEHVPFLLNCCGNYPLYKTMQEMLETPVACLGLQQSYEGCGGGHEVLCERVPLAHYEARDDARFYACMEELERLDPDQKSEFRICAFAMRKRLLHECRVEQRPGTQESGIPAASYQHMRARLRQQIEVTADPDTNRVQREIYSLLEKFYLALCGEGGKMARLRSLLQRPDAVTQRIAIITPKASEWSEALRRAYPYRRLTVTTARTFDPAVRYDLLIVTGRMTDAEDGGDAFCRVPLGWNAERTVFLLYAFEEAWGERLLRRWKRQRDDFQRAAGWTASSEEDPKALEQAGPMLSDDWDEIERRLPSWGAQLQAYWGTKGRAGDQKARVMALATLVDGRHLLISDARKGRKPFKSIAPCKDDEAKNMLRELRGKDVQPGMRFIYANDFGTRGELLQTFLRALGEQGWDPADLACVEEWQQGLQRYRKEYQLTWEDLRQELNAHGADISNIPRLRSWLIADSTALGPLPKQKTQVFKAIGAVLPATFAHHTWQEYLTATDRVRAVRRTLQQLMTKEIPNAYIAKENGETPESSRQQTLMEHLDDICDVYEVEDVQPLSVIVSQNLVNRPLEDVPLPEEGEQG